MLIKSFVRIVRFMIFSSTAPPTVSPATISYQGVRSPEASEVSCCFHVNVFFILQVAIIAFVFKYIRTLYAPELSESITICKERFVASGKTNLFGGRHCVI